MGVLLLFPPSIGHTIGPRLSGPVGTDVVLAGSASDPDGDPLTSSWLLSVIAGGGIPRRLLLTAAPNLNPLGA